jgi:predicted acyltransferase
VGVPDTGRQLLPPDAATAPVAASVVPKETVERHAGGPPRWVSLDAFRGITIAAMLVVNHPGNYEQIYSPLRHAEWNGWTPTDLIFPFFLFIVGVSLRLSLPKQLERGLSHRQILTRVLKRALVLFALGLVLTSFPWWHRHLHNVRIPGVLQRIALTYLAAAPLVLWLRARGQVILAAALLLGYWALMSWVPVPGIGPGVWQPGLDLGAYVDRMLLGVKHLRPGTWDPAGLLSTIPALATVLLGALAGQWLCSGRNATRKLVGMLLMGAAGIVLGVLWGQVFPINKNLWTSSYAVFTGGMAFVLLAGLYWLVDVKGFRRWTHPFVLLGVNAILVYVLSELTDMMLNRIRIDAAGSPTVHMAVYDVFFGSWLPPLDASLAFSIGYLLFWLAAMAALHRRGIRVSV